MERVIENVTKQSVVSIVNNLLDSRVVSTVESGAHCTTDEGVETLALSCSSETPPRTGCVEQFADDN